MHHMCIKNYHTNVKSNCNDRHVQSCSSKAKPCLPREHFQCFYGAIMYAFICQLLRLSQLCSQHVIVSCVLD